MDIGTYKYSPLPQRDSIRLLVVQPSRVHAEPLHGTLLTTTLADCDYDLIGSYTALSYVWGDASQTGTIILDRAHTVTITATLTAALRDLRDASRPRCIWADALCIDQANLPERNHQVALMGAIYRTAHNTVIHLGARSAETSLILHNTPRAAASIHPPALVDGSAREAIHRAAAADLLQRPWFRRVWVFQELVLSRDPWVQCGDLRVRWTDLVDLLVPDAGYGAGGGLDPPFRVLAGMQDARRGSNAGNMAMLLKARRGLGATDPRDFVYAHLGLASDAAAVLADVPVDYALPLGRVFGRTAMYVLQSLGLENLLGMVDGEGSVGRTGELPSWAPDWRREGGKRGDMYKDTTRNSLQLEGNNLFAFIDEPGTETEPKPKPPLLLLLVPGYHMDVIARLGVLLPPKPTESIGERYQQAVDGVHAIYAVGGGVWYSGDQLGQYPHVNLRGKEAEHERLCRVMGEEWTGFLRRGRTPAADDDDDNDKFLHALGRWLGDQAARKRIYVGPSSDGLVRLLHDYAHQGIPGSPLDGRRLAQTQTGAFGLVPPHAREGDVVVSLAKNETAVLLRPVVATATTAVTGGREVLDSKIERTMQAKNLSLKASVGNKPLWTTSLASTHDVEHCSVVGHCYFDGQVAWSASESAKAEEIKVFALH